ncbi:EamA domain-containing membrane protein RarD [Lutibacter agarilyticus]|uniref:EamA domain-containing membrane protein RarD n=1 Tax=Lutibacter agarilyticus TaxID=1109740 RepID=A0A238VJD1_9FLAO|nr:DMT family transporter [Lutibacter agarilyticus]SNR33813.1 EamA domain-containing membrane protein RarD [Lutibacter agarilyticus]
MGAKKSIQYMLISTFAFACMNATVKYLENVSAYQIVFFRSASSLIFTFTFLLKNNIPILGNNKKLLILRGVVGVTSMTLFFMSVKYLSVGTAVSLRYLAPIFAGIFAVFFLKERIWPLQWLFFVMAFLGVLVLKGLDSQINSTGLILVIIAAITSGLVYNIISKIGKSEHPVVVVNYFMVIATITGLVLSLNSWVNPVGIEWVLLFSLGVFGYYGQVFMTKAFQNGKTDQIAPIKYVEVLFTVVFGLLLFDEIYSIWSLLGISLIIGSLVLNVLYKSRKNA